jgi:single-strand DNA-binding protein
MLTENRKYAILKKHQNERNNNMQGFSSVTILGNVTADPEVKYTFSGKAVAQFSIAVNRKYTVDGVKQEQVSFFTIAAWNRTAEAVGEYVHKGDPLFVSGQLKEDTWVDGEGRNKSRVKVIADRVVFLGKKPAPDQITPEDFDIPVPPPKQSKSSASQKPKSRPPQQQVPDDPFAGYEA